MDVLPASLESLELVGCMPWERDRAFFAGFLELKADKMNFIQKL